MKIKRMMSIVSISELIFMLNIYVVNVVNIFAKLLLPSLKNHPFKDSCDNLESKDGINQIINKAIAVIWGMINGFSFFFVSISVQTCMNGMSIAVKWE